MKVAKIRPDLRLNTVCQAMCFLINYYAGVVAFIEVRSNTENRFEGISKQMEMLGAKVKIYNLLKIMNVSCRCTCCSYFFILVNFYINFPLIQI